MAPFDGHLKKTTVSIITYYYTSLFVLEYKAMEPMW